jgi:hypothetical protein
LVEGSTEVPAVQRLLREYDAEHRIVLLPLGGSTLINQKSASQLEEISRLSSSIWVLIDSERNNARADLDKARDSFIKNCKRLGFETCVLERRALENYFTDRAVKAARGADAGALGPFEKLKDATRPWGKADNWRIASEMRRQELERTDLGRFLKRLAGEASRTLSSTSRGSRKRVARGQGRGPRA